MAVFAIGAAVAAFMLGSGTSTEIPAPYRVERVTSTSGVTGWPAISGDGRLVAYASDGGTDGTPLQIWIQQVGVQASKLTDCVSSCTDPSFSADSTHVLYTAGDPAGPSLYEVPVKGGPSRLLRAGPSWHGSRRRAEAESRSSAATRM